MKKKYPFNAIGSKLKLLRGEMIQRSFAQVVGLSERAYRRYEKGERLPNFETLMRISVFCECSLEWLVTGGKRGESKLKVKRQEINTILGRLEELSEKDKRRLKDLIEDHKKLRIKRERFKHQLGVPPGVEEYYWIEPRGAEARDMLNYIFSNGSEDVIQFVMDALDAASTFAFLGMNMDGRVEWGGTEGVDKNPESPVVEGGGAGD